MHGAWLLDVLKGHGAQPPGLAPSEDSGNVFGQFQWPGVLGMLLDQTLTALSEAQLCVPVIMYREELVSLFWKN